MLRALRYLSVCSLLFLSCSRKTSIFQDAVAAWFFPDLNDQSGLNSRLQQQGTVQISAKAGDNKPGPRENGSGGNAAYFDGSTWLTAGQGINGELKIHVRGISIFIRMKPDTIKEYNPLLTKSGNDQNIAYSITLHKKEEELYIEAMLGSDDIGGAHLLKYKIPKEEWLKWHDILFRFNGKRSELYIDGILRDNEVTEGEIRDWNHHPVLIGPQYKEPYTDGDTAKNTIESTFKGWIGCIAVWDRFLADKKAAPLFGVAALDHNGLPEYYNEKHRPQFHFTAKRIG